MKSPAPAAPSTQNLLPLSYKIGNTVINEASSSSSSSLHAGRVQLYRCIDLTNGRLFAVEKVATIDGYGRHDGEQKHLSGYEVEKRIECCCSCVGKIKIQE
jgi:hypothetical protein